MVSLETNYKKITSQIFLWKLLELTRELSKINGFNIHISKFTTFLYTETELSRYHLWCKYLMMLGIDLINVLYLWRQLWSFIEIYFKRTQITGNILVHQISSIQKHALLFPLSFTGNLSEIRYILKFTVP